MRLAQLSACSHIGRADVAASRGSACEARPAHRPRCASHSLRLAVASAEPTLSQAWGNTSPTSGRRVRQSRTRRGWATAPLAGLCSSALLSRRQSWHCRKAGQCILRQGQRAFRSPFGNLRAYLYVFIQIINAAARYTVHNDYSVISVFICSSACCAWQFNTP